MEYILPILLFLVFGVVFGVLLTVISKVFAVKVDERTRISQKSCRGQTAVHAVMLAVPTMPMPLSAKVPHECLSAGRCSSGWQHWENYGRCRLRSRTQNPCGTLQRHLYSHQTKIRI